MLVHFSRAWALVAYKLVTCKRKCSKWVCQSVSPSVTPFSTNLHHDASYNNFSRMWLTDGRTTVTRSPIYRWLIATKNGAVFVCIMSVLWGRIFWYLLLVDHKKNIQTSIKKRIATKLDPLSKLTDPNLLQFLKTSLIRADSKKINKQQILWNGWHPPR